MIKSFTVQVGDIFVEASDTDDILLKKAQTYLPRALKIIGEKMAQELWANMEREFSNSSIKFSNSEKVKFIRENGANYVRKATVADKQDLVETIVEQLKQQRNDKS